MSKQSKKPSFLGGAAVLAAAVAIVKVIGAVYKIPFGNIVGSQGQTYFNVAYNIYNVLLTISTAGLPLAISKLTSQAHAQGRENPEAQDLPHRHLAVLRAGSGRVCPDVLRRGAAGRADP